MYEDNKKKLLHLGKFKNIITPRSRASARASKKNFASYLTRRSKNWTSMKIICNSRLDTESGRAGKQVAAIYFVLKSNYAFAYNIHLRMKSFWSEGDGDDVVYRVCAAAYRPRGRMRPRRTRNSAKTDLFESVYMLVHTYNVAHSLIVLCSRSLVHRLII